MRNRSLANATSAIYMDVLIVIDTEYLKTNYPNPSQNPNNPTGIDHISQFMICAGTRGVISGQGTATLSFKANPGDYVSFYATSIYANSNDAVILNNIKQWSGENVLDTFTVNLVERTNAVRPDVNAINGFPAVTGVDSFISLDSRVIENGTATFLVYFTIYTLADDRETQVLCGYYCWNPTITAYRTV